MFIDRARSNPPSSRAISRVTVEAGVTRDRAASYMLHRPCVRKIPFTSFMDDTFLSLSRSLSLSGNNDAASLGRLRLR